MELFEFDDYKSYLAHLINKQPRGFQAKLAKALGCQASYLINVLSNKGDLTDDRALKAAEFLKLNEIEKEYFLLLASFERATTPELKNYISVKLSKLKTSGKKLKSRMPQNSDIEITTAVEYYSSWDISIIHLATSIQQFQDPKKIAERFNFKPKRVEKVLNFLVQKKLVKNENNRWIFNGDPIFLDRDSPLNQIHQMGRRDQVERSIKEKGTEDIHFASNFVVDKKTFDKIRSEVRRLIEESHSKIVKAPSEDIYSMVIDLYRVT